MILLRDYNEKEKLDRAWFQSSNVLYSECEDKLNELKVLRVTFNNGATYEYSDVDVNDYVMFLAGGLEHSHGKALNEFIKKKKCPYKKLENKDINLIKEEMEQIKQLREQKKGED
jgi:hypothetical protein